MLRHFLILAAFVQPCQDPAAPIRKPLRGSVRTLSGAPWAGARVFLVASATPFERRASTPDVVAVKSDERGRFRGMVRRGVSYSVWARSEPIDGIFRCTVPHDGGLAGGSVHLRESPFVHRVRTLRLTGREAWADREPLTFDVVSQTASPYGVQLEPDAEGRLVLPPLPGVDGLLEVYGKDGSPVMIRRLQLVDMQGRDAKASDELKMPERFPWLLQVVKRTGRKPIAGVRVYQRISYQGMRNRWMLAGSTDENGFAALAVTAYQDSPATSRQHLFMYVQGPGCAYQQFGRSAALKQRDDTEQRRANKQADYTAQVLGEAAGLKGRIMLGEGRPAAGCRLLLFASAGNQGGRSFYLNLDPTILETDAAGRFETVGWGPRFAYRLCLVVDDKVAGALGEPRDIPLAPVIVAALGVADGDTDLGNVSLAALERMDLRIHRADGFPAAGAEVWLTEASGDFKLMRKDGGAETIQVYGYKGLRLTASRRGRLRVLLPDTKLLQLVIHHAGAWRFMPMDADGKRARTIQLDEPIIATGRVVDGSGKPVPGAFVSVNPTRYPPGFDTRLSGLLSLRRVRTDADGKFRLGLPFPDTMYYFWAWAQVGDRRYSTQGRNVIEVERTLAEPVELEVPVPKANLPILGKAAKGSGSTGRD